MKDLAWIAKQPLKEGVVVLYFLNKKEPKNEQFYKLILCNFKVDALYVFNLKSERFEEVTSLFSENYLDNLSNCHKPHLPQLNKSFFLPFL
ncbi:hypothetical protein LC087_02465 [Bacillus carboniphilus]|uniref:Uncharacterized protein n=1 Tax=Bacillus carboniphilus TaxID=86663 RepID=A0ABY9JUN6_9BACI|nr:hypothetical protein [Bacillus carboniphilus]WLR43092.1 hypothetical protein LC087_02465 [Bacillus carboniphilus]